MGKEYAAELHAMTETYSWARRLQIPALAKFASRATSLPLIAVGSGGSVTAAEFASLLHPAVSCTMTPQEFLERAIPHDCAVLLVSAGGNNHDILAAYAKAIKERPKVIGIVCASPTGKLARMAATNRDVLLHAAAPPVGRDGFLATNTLLGTVVWIFRAWGCRLPHSLYDSEYRGVLARMFDSHVSTRLKKFRDADGLLILYDIYGKPAAIDAESKLHEAGLVPVQLADYRNFAHGRHNWIAKHPRTLVLALVTPSSSNLAVATLEQIPDDCRVAMVSDIAGPAAALYLLLTIFHVVKFFGISRGIDPGDPKPPKFGRKFYHMDVSRYVDVDGDESR